MRTPQVSLLLLTIFLALVFLTFFTNSALVYSYTDQSTYYSCDNCSDCNTALDNSTYKNLRLSTNFNNNGSSACLTLDVADYTLNCAGYHINGTSNPSIGISITANNVTVSSCVLRDFPRAIVATGTQIIITNNTVINSTTEGIYAAGAYASISANNITQSNEGIDARDSGITITNNDFLDNAKDLYLTSSSRNASVNNNRFIGNGTNAAIQASGIGTGHHIRNNTFASYEYGIWTENILSHIAYNTFTSCAYGIYDTIGSNSSGNTMSACTTGIKFVYGSTNGRVTNTSISGGTIGILVNGTGHNINNNSITNNAKGIILGGASNTIANNTITQSSAVGISLVNSVTALIYNNFFNNTLNNEISGSGTNYWSTTQHNGNNIVGYQVIGGNAWFTPTDGFSAGCADTNKDGICDFFTGVANNIDYLPLSLQGQAPIVTAQSPINNAYNDSSDPATQTFNCSGEDNYTKLSALSVYIWNASGNLTYSDSKLTGEVNTSSKSWVAISLANGTYTWNCKATDQAGVEAWGTNYTYKINYTDNETPNVTAQTPADGYANENGVQVLELFVCLVEDNYDLKNVSFYITNEDNTSFTYNQSASVDGTSGTAIFEQMLSTGNYTWNCLAADQEGNLDWGDNHSYYVNGTRANVTNLNTSEEFETIQAAINDGDTLNGHTLSIPAGEFYENINVNKALTLRGVGATTKISADNMGSPVFTISADNVTLESLNISRATTSQAIAASDLRRLTLKNLSIGNCDEGIILNNVTTSTIRGISFSRVNTSINGSDLASATFTSITAVANNRTAIHIRDSTALTMTSITANIANATAILLENITGGTLTSITARNGLNGLWLSGVTDMTLSTITVTGHNNSGIRLINSGSNSLGSVTATSNGDGLYVHASSFITLSDSNIKSNARGIVLNDSDGSIITDNNISQNTQIGFLVLSTTNADFYDNYFQNNNNTYDTGTNEYYKSGSGTNIIGGSTIGGNYYINLSGSGCSASAEVIDTDGDRVADTGTCSIAGGSSVDRSPLTYNYIPPEEVVVNTSSSGGGSSGGSSYSAPPITKHTFVTIYNNVKEGDNLLWSLTSSRPVVRQLSLTPKKAADRLELSIGQYDVGTEPDIVPEPLDGVVRYLKIDPIGLASKDAENVEFLMDLPTGKDMYIYDNGAWVPLKKTKEENYWRVESPHMSWFAIGSEGGGSTSQSTGPVCGDGIIEGGELCDGTALNGATCASRVPRSSGTISCTRSCTFDTSSCAVPPPACSRSCGTDGTCNSLCGSDPLCSPDPDCAAPAVCPYSCASDGRCVNGCANVQACIPDPDCGIDVVEEKPGNMFGILLWVLLGLLVLGGGGAALYFFVLQKDDDVTSMFPKAGSMASGDKDGSRSAGESGGLELPRFNANAGTGSGPNIVGASSDSFGTKAEIIPDSVVSWVHKHLSGGYDPADVKIALVKKGWSTVHAEEAVNKAQKFMQNIL